MLLEECQNTTSKRGEIIVNFPQPISLVIRDFNLKDPVLEEQIIEELWLPIRKDIRLNHNIDIVMCSNKGTIAAVDKDGNPIMTEEEEPRQIVCPEIRFLFMASTAIYDDIESEPAEAVYQKLKLRNGVEEDVRDVQDDASKVHMTYIDFETYKSALHRTMAAAERIDLCNLEGRNPDEKPVILREMVREKKIPNNEDVVEQMKRAVKLFAKNLQEYADGIYEEKVNSGHVPKLNRARILSLLVNGEVLA